MKVTAFIRKTSAKNNVTEMARIYFRVRDVGGVDLKVSYLSIPTIGVPKDRATNHVWFWHRDRNE